ncbi:MAG: AAA family ATPase [Ectothiorhodospiraceae bacterium]|nr:AAA family ATPase [Ectothiorhodospiraceae bacterium]
MKLRIPDSFRVSSEAMQKAVTRNPRTEPERPAFDEAKLLRLLDKADRLHHAHAAVTEQRDQALQRVRELERHAAWLDERGHAMAGDGDAATENQHQAEKLEQDLDRAQREFDRLDEAWEDSRGQYRQARALATRLEDYARDELGWTRPGEPTNHATT